MELIDEIKEGGFPAVLKILETKNKEDVKLLVFAIWLLRLESSTLIHRKFDYRGGHNDYFKEYITNIELIFSLIKEVAASKDENIWEKVDTILNLKDKNNIIAYGYRIRNEFIHQTVISKNDKHYEQIYELIKNYFPEEWENYMWKSIFINNCKIYELKRLRKTNIEKLLKSCKNNFSNFISKFFVDKFGLSIGYLNMEKNAGYLNIIEIIEGLLRGKDGCEKLSDFLLPPSDISSRVSQNNASGLSSEDKKNLKPEDLTAKVIDSSPDSYKKYFKNLSENKCFPVLIEKLKQLQDKNFTEEYYNTNLNIITDRKKHRPASSQGDETKIIAFVKTFIIEKIFEPKQENQKRFIIRKISNQDQKISATTIVTYFIALIFYDFSPKDLSENIHKTGVVRYDNICDKVKQIRTVDLDNFKLGRLSFNDIKNLYKREFKWDYNDNIPLSAHCEAYKAHKNGNYGNGCLDGINCLKGINCLIIGIYAMSLDLNPAVGKVVLNF